VPQGCVLVHAPVVCILLGSLLYLCERMCIVVCDVVIL